MLTVLFKAPTFLTAILFILNTNASAESAPAMIFKGKNIGPLVEFYRPQVKPLTKSVTVYNWTQGVTDPFWKVDRPQSDPEFLNMAKSESEVFWDKYGNFQGAKYNYGYGLYGAVDAIATKNNYGALDWVLLQMELPIGFKLVNLIPSDKNLVPPLPPEAKSILTSFQCPPGIDLNNFFVGGGAGLPASCRELVSRIFKDILKIDGFAYSYTQTFFKACNTASYESNAAFVITNPEWMKSGLIKYFNENTRSDEIDRIRIQTVFLAGTENLQTNELPVLKLQNYLMSHPTYYVESSVTKCAAESCVITVHLCMNPTTCQDLNLDPIPRPGGGIITAEAAKRSAGGKLLWSDLDGKPKAPSINKWLQKNKFACDGTLPYVTGTDPRQHPKKSSP